MRLLTLVPLLPRCIPWFVIALACWGVRMSCLAAVPEHPAGTNAISAPAPEFAAGSWLNLPATATNMPPSLKGKVTVVHFWTFGCINCQHNLPYYDRWQKNLGPLGLQIVGIHTPETPGERDPANVRRKVKELHITYPVLLDPESRNWQQWQQSVWPSVYLVDKRGRVRFAWEGELEYNGADGFAKMTRLIRALLAE